MNTSDNQTDTSRIFKDANSFSLYIEEIARNKKCSHIDIVLKYCNENFIDPQEIKSLINKSLKDKMQNDFQDSGHLPKQAQLDV